MAATGAPDTEEWDAIILGAGAAGMFAAAHAAQTGGRVLAVDHAKAPGEKIRISGGGRCNFTNLETRADRFLSQNPHFAKSALSRYGPQDFIALIEAHRIPYHEKTLGQLFCDRSAKDVIEMLRAEMAAAGAALRLETAIGEIARRDGRFEVTLDGAGRRYTASAAHLVVATGGKSIPKMGASDLAYRIARQFGMAVVETRPALAPLTFGGASLEMLKALSGVAVDGVARNARIAFEEAILFTHRGLSGPAILQLSSYWREGESITLDLAPGRDLFAALRQSRAEHGKRDIATALSQHLPKRLAHALAQAQGWRGAIGGTPDKALRAIDAALHGWTLTPTGSEGYRTAEVTLGGVDTDALDARSMAARDVPGLYFIGEAVDVTGWLGGYNFQWAWSSAHAAGAAIACALANAALPR